MLTLTLSDLRQPLPSHHVITKPGAGIASLPTRRLITAAGSKPTLLALRWQANYKPASSMLVSRGRSSRPGTVYVRNNNSSKDNIAGHVCFVKNINYSKEGAYTMTSTLDRKVRANKFAHRRQRSDDTDTIQGRVRSLLHNPIQTNGLLHVHHGTLPDHHSFSRDRPTRRSSRRNGKETYPHRRMAERTSSIPAEEILHCGWLKKQGGAFRTWQRRWFVLAGDYLYYYNKEDDNRPLGAVPLRNNKVEKHPHNPDDPGKFLFEILPGEVGQTRIIHSHETMLLWAGSQHESDEWIQHIRRVIYGRKGGGIFGQSLLDTITHESHTSTKMIPSIVEQCCDFLRDKGLQEEGLFRLPGRAALVRELQEQFDCGQKPDFHQQNIDIHTVASLFKLYLRQLPEPVIPWQHYQAFYEGIRILCNNEAEGIQELIRQLAVLPRTNYNLLKYICEFLNEVQSYESQNRMGVMNLATVFGPNIFRPMEESTATLMESTAMSSKFVHLLIKQNLDLFPPNHLINFNPSVAMSNGGPHGNGGLHEPTPTPVPPPRQKGRHNQYHQPPQPQPRPQIDLLKELKENIDNSPAQTKPDIGNTHDSLLIDFDSDEAELMQMMSGRSSFAAVNKRSFSVDDTLGLRDSMNLSESTLADSNSTLGESGSTDGGPASSRSSRNPSFSDFQAELSASVKNANAGNRESLVIFNPSAASDPPRPKPLKERPVSMVESKSPPPVSPRKPKPTLDLTSTTPEASARQSMDVAFQYSNLQEQVRALKAELIEVKDERDQKLLKMKMQCEGLQIKLSNENETQQVPPVRGQEQVPPVRGQVKALKEELIKVNQEKTKLKATCDGLQMKLTNEETLRKAAEERNKQLLAQINAFLEEYSPQLS